MTKRVQGRRRRAGRSGTALAAAAALAGGLACAEAPARLPKILPPPPDYTVNIAFDVVNGVRCPVQAIPQGVVCSPKQQCPVHVLVKYGQPPPQVLFQATDLKTGKPTQDKLAVQFDPFRGPPDQGVGSVRLTVLMGAKKGAIKTFPYNVQSGTCDPLDPDVQVEW